jgi:hypothetical protein
MTRRAFDGTLCESLAMGDGTVRKLAGAMREEYVVGPGG